MTGEPNAIERLAAAVIRADRPGDVRTSRPSHQRASAYLRDAGERAVRFIASPEAVEILADTIGKALKGTLAARSMANDLKLSPRDKAMIRAQAVLQLLALKGMGE